MAFTYHTLRKAKHPHPKLIVLYLLDINPLNLCHDIVLELLS